MPQFVWPFPNMQDNIDAAKNLLSQHDYIVHKNKSWRQLIERVRVAEALRNAAEQHEKHTRRWAQTELHNQIRDLQARCAFLYGAARAHGASIEELAGGWTPAGINMPTETATTIQCHCGTHPYKIQVWAQLDTETQPRRITKYVCPQHGLVLNKVDPVQSADVGLKLVDLAKLKLVDP
jgi:hypothetical protein